MMVEPKDGVISSRRFRNDAISKSSSDLIFIVGKVSLVSAAVIPFAIVTIDIHIGRTISSARLGFVMIGKTAFSMVRQEDVAWRQGEMLLVVIENEYLSTIGFDSAPREEDSAPLV